MLDSFLISLRCILPIVALILLGFCLKRFHFVTDAGGEVLDRLSFRLLLPAMLFRSVISADFTVDMDPKFILLGLGISLLSFIAALLLSYLKCGPSGPTRASMAQAILRNNCVVFGMSLISSMYGDAATGQFSMLLAVVIPVNNILAVVLLSVLTNNKIKPLKILRNIVTNPFVLAVAAGLLIQALGWKLPASAETVVNHLANAASAIALIGLGAGIHFEQVDRKAWSNIAYGVIARLILLPVICAPVLLLSGMRDIRLIALYVLVATPTAESSFVMAKEMGADAKLAGHLVVFQTVFSPLTILIGFMLLSLGGFIHLGAF